MWLVSFVHNEGGPLKGFVAHHTGETLRVVGIACGPQHPVCDSLLAHTALFQGTLKNKSRGFVLQEFKTHEGVVSGRDNRLVYKLPADYLQFNTLPRHGMVYSKECGGHTADSLHTTYACRGEHACQEERGWEDTVVMCLFQLAQ